MKPTDLLSEIRNPWHKVYWFSRMLISSDKYAKIGNEPKLLTLITSSLRVIARDNKGDNTLELQKHVLKNIIEERFKKATKNIDRVRRLLNDLDLEISNSFEMDAFILTCENIMLPLNQAISNIPSDDKEFTLNIAKTYLDVEGDKGLATVISLWDDIGVKGCLTAERTEIVKAFSTLKVILSSEYLLSEIDKDIVLTSFVQEFERRAGQKKTKSRRKFRRCNKFYFRILQDKKGTILSGRFRSGIGLKLRMGG
ncbi:MAG: hypothetical protein IPH28_02245 [Cytophagaceae bacterium]|nr:hypothetical protein [Cytophagaceae bacterium]